MKNPLLVLGLWGAVLSTGMTAESFLDRLTPEEFKAAGLAKLSAEELAQIESLFAKYRTTSGPTGPSAIVAQPQPPPPPAAAASNASASQEMAAKLAAAEEQVRVANQEAAAAREAAEKAQADQKKAETGLLAKARKILVSPGTKVEIAAVESRIDGLFTGWDNRTSWVLEDGSHWRVENSVNRYTARAVEKPKVRISPATLSGFWMEFPDLDLKVRVRRVE